jgi:hypothetical protein
MFAFMLKLSVAFDQDPPDWGKGARFYPRKGLQASRIAAGVGPGLVGVSLTAF